MADDRYIELLEDAQDALYALLKDTEPGTGLILHRAYADIKRVLLLQANTKREATPPAPAPDKEEKSELALIRERGQAWRTMPWHTRERLLLDALKDDALTKSEIVQRLNADQDEFTVWHSNLPGLLNRMIEAREIEQIKEEWRNRFRYRYRRRVDLDGIAELNRALEGEEA